MALTREQWSQAQAAYEDLVEVPAGQRAPMLRRLEQLPPLVAAEVRALLAATDDDYLATPVAVTAPGPVAEPALAAGTRFGAWRVLGPIGRGGMGEVYLAERADGAYEQRIALKLLKRGLDTDALVQRFLRERRILGSLVHPNIVRLLDAGAAPDGRPWLAMEYVEGRPITEWCRARGSPLRPALERMIDACEAVNAAHRRHIVHRDLKPSNLLVTTEGEVKLLDFGIARLLDEEAQQTQLGGHPLTPRYAAPEQLLGAEARPAADVYALGVILHELLAGRPPFGARGLSDAALAAARRQAPPRPSQALRRQPLPGAPQRARELEGELDLILLKALQPDPARRYAGAAEFADELRRYLDGRPIAARPDAWSYRARKFVVRNRVPVGAATLALLALLGGLGTALWQGHLAQQRAAELARVVDFQGAMLKRVDVAQIGAAWLDRIRANIAATLARDEPLPPDQAAAALARFDQMREWGRPVEAARQTLADHLLDPERAEIGGRFAASPATAGRLRASLGQAYADLGAYAEAIAELEQALALQEATLGARHPDTLSTRLALAQVQVENGDGQAAQDNAQAVVGGREAVLGPGARPTLAARAVLASILTRQGDYAAARAIAEPLLAQQRARFGAEDADTLETERQLAGILSSQGDSAAARKLAEHALEADRRTLGPDSAQTRGAMRELIFDLFQLEDYAAARKLAAELLETSRATLGDDHPDTLKAMSNLAAMMSRTGEDAAATRLQREAWQRYRRVLGEDSPATQYAANNYAAGLRDQGALEPARAIQQRVLEVRRRTRGPEHPETLNALENLATTLGQLKQYPAALALHRQALEAERRVLGPSHPRTLETWRGLGETLLASGDAATALGELQAARAARVAASGADSPEAVSLDVDSAIARRDLGQLEPARAALEADLASLRRIEGPEHPDTYSCAAELAETLHRLRRDAEAQVLAGQVLAGRRKAGALSQDTVAAERALARYDEALGQGRAARELRRQADAEEAQLRAQWAALVEAAGA